MASIRAPLLDSHSMTAETEVASKQPVFLLDTMSFIFRAYHAMQRSRPMSTRSGLPTAATYVFVNMITKLRADFAPHYLAAVFDVSGAVFRDAKAQEIGVLRRWSSKDKAFVEISYEGYKAQREAMPEDLARQLPYIRRSLEALHIPILEAAGFEADDVIGTLARQASEEGHEVFIVSGDKDMMQLINEHVRVLNPQKDNLVIDPAKVIEILGVPPQQVIDVMALRGDTIDNVPGAPGIGDKGSVELIQQFGSVEAVLDRAEEVKRKTYRESLQQNRETVLLSKELVTIDCNVPIELDLAQMQTTDPDLEAARELFTELEFTSMLRDLAPGIKKPTAELIEDPAAEQITAFFAAAPKHGFAFALDKDARLARSESSSGSTETNAEVAEEEALPPMPTLLDAFEAAEESQVGKEATPEYLGVSVKADDKPELALRLQLTPQLRTLLENEQVPKFVHDWKSTSHHLSALGVTLRGPITDTMLLSYALNPTHATQSLIDVAARAGQPVPASLPGAAHAIQTLTPTLRKEVEEHKLTSVYETIDLPLVPVLFRMESSGVRIHLGALDELSQRFGSEIHRVSERIFILADRRFNINSPKQLGEVLFTHMGLPKPLIYGKGKKISTAQDVLENLAEEHEIAQLVIEFRHLAKLKSNYVDALPLLVDKDSRVHTTFNAASTATGRLSSVNPNLQNIPIRTELGREIRAAFVAAPGYRLLSADYSQIELRLMAHFSEDPLLADAYRTGRDIHTLTASEVFGISPDKMDKHTRARAKAVNFGIVYGISAFGLAAQLSIPQGEAKLYIERYFARYAGVKSFIDRTIEETRKQGYVRTLFGRMRPIPDIESRNANQRGFAERTAINTPLQGTAADMIKLAMIAIDRKLAEHKLRTRMVLQVHDELLFEVPEDEEDAIVPIVKDSMENVVTLKVPIEADLSFGHNWRDME
ncbi:DNA polymerase I [Acidicapsa dinghuensis]|uniref:DNA polymerase I n=1 Tax=Acidicapsa dinghuensis TaxID=2218256 RepID=A0ABW1EHL1_9BACT|nr:DNA polymerase I [Acidicapsa dinghuensis]